MRGFPGGSAVKNSPTNSGDTGAVPGSGRFPGEGNGNLLQYSYNSRDGGDWQGAVHGGLKESDTTEGLTGHLRNKIEVGLVTRLGKEGIWPEEIWRKQEDKFSGLRVYDSHLHLLSSFKLSLTVLPLLKHVDCVCV